MVRFSYSLQNWWTVRTTCSTVTSALSCWSTFILKDVRLFPVFLLFFGWVYGSFKGIPNCLQWKKKRRCPCLWLWILRPINGADNMYKPLCISPRFCVLFTLQDMQSCSAISCLFISSPCQHCQYLWHLVVHHCGIPTIEENKTGADQDEEIIRRWHFGPHKRALFTMKGARSYVVEYMAWGASISFV